VNSELQTQTQKYRQLVSALIDKYLAKDKPESLYEPMRYALQGGGKMLRPTLALIACCAVGGNEKDALDAAAAIELAHNFTLVHDDIMDNDEMRRGRDTVYKKWDANVGILSGDALLVKAYEALNQVNSAYLPRTLKEFNQAILKVCEGQALDMEFESRQDVTLEEYYYMIDRKTARLFSLSCVTGAILGGGSETEIESLRTFGLELGRAFQIQDDLLDLLADQKTLGKDIGSDIQANKKTFLMLYIREHADEQTLLQLAGFQKKTRLTDEDIQWVIDVMEKVGAVDGAKNQVRDALADARAALEHLQDTESRHLLSAMLDTLEHRTF